MKSQMKTNLDNTNQDKKQFNCSQNQGWSTAARRATQSYKGVMQINPILE